MNENVDNCEEKKRFEGHYVALGVAFGAALGAAFGNLAVGVALGVALGAAFGAALWIKRSKRTDA